MSGRLVSTDINGKMGGDVRKVDGIEWKGKAVVSKGMERVRGSAACIGFEG